MKIYLKSKRQKMEISEELHKEEYLEENIETMKRGQEHLQELEKTISLVINRLCVFEDMFRIIERKIKRKCNEIESNTIKETTITLAFPIQNIKEVSQFDSTDLDIITESFIKKLFNEYKNFSIVFKHLLKDELVLLLSSWENMSKYRLFSEIMYEAMKEIFAEYEDFILEMRKQIVKAINRVKWKNSGLSASDTY